MNMKYNIALNKQAGLEVDQEKCPSSLLPFSLPSFSSLPHPFPSRSLAPFPMCDFPISGFFAQIQLRSLASTVSSPSGSGKTPTDIRFLVHSELKIALSVIALFNKFLDDHACVMVCIGPALRHNGMVFLRKEVALLFEADQRHAGLCCPTSSPANRK